MAREINADAYKGLVYSKTSGNLTALRNKNLGECDTLVN